jgi:hypothetical protein
MDMWGGVALPSLCAEGSPSAVTILRRQGRADLHPAGLWGQRLHRILSQPPAEGVLQPQPLEQSVRDASSSATWKLRSDLELIHLGKQVRELLGVAYLSVFELIGERGIKTG